MFGNTGFVLGGVRLIVPVRPGFRELHTCFTDDFPL